VAATCWWQKVEADCHLPGTVPHVVCSNHNLAKTMLAAPDMDSSMQQSMLIRSFA
jgi:hypothetical protein